MSEQKTLNLYPIDYPFETLFQRSSSKPPKLILNPEFQRKYKWDKDGNERASKFIESCLMRIPLPACYFAENDKGFHEVIDGVQRITTIKNFFNDEFRLEGLSILKDLEGKSFSELGDLKNELENTTIRCIVLRKENPKELIQEIFARLNQGAVELTPQEIRHAIYPGSLDNLLIELGDIDFIKNFGKGEAGLKVKDGRESEEMILRFFAFQTDLSDYDDKLSKYLDKFSRINQNLDSENIENLKSLFNNTLEKCMIVFDGNPFIDLTKMKAKQSLVYYDLLMWSLKDYPLEYLNENKPSIKALFEDLCNDISFTKTLSGGLQQKSSINKRRTIWTEKLSTLNG
nr:DUF262 domain-containing protein [uncultured Flavobacterium sp.]